VLGLGGWLLNRVMWKSGGFGWMRTALGGRGLGIACGKCRKGGVGRNCLRPRLGNVLLVLPAEVDQGDTRISLKDWARSSCWATRGILAFYGERKHEGSMYDLAVRPKLEAGMGRMYEKD